MSWQILHEVTRFRCCRIMFLPASYVTWRHVERMNRALRDSREGVCNTAHPGWCFPLSTSSHNVKQACLSCFVRLRLGLLGRQSWAKPRTFHDDYVTTCHYWIQYFTVWFKIQTYTHQFLSLEIIELPVLGLPSTDQAQRTSTTRGLLRFSFESLVKWNALMQGVVFANSSNTDMLLSFSFK